MMATDIAELIAESNHPEAKNILDILILLGMPSTLRKISSDLDIYDLLQRGLPPRVIKSFIKKTGFATRDISAALLITEQKLKKLLSDSNRTVLTPIESSAIWQFASVFVVAEGALKSKEAARDWFFFKPRGTVYRKPIDLLALPIGIEFILRYLHQIRHGVYI